MERDVDRIYHGFSTAISTHTLTWSVTERDQEHHQNHHISTHTLTWSVTCVLLLI
nr:MAG TPA: hypothetical protein [Caudoviricetes sp.]